MYRPLHLLPPANPSTLAESRVLIHLARSPVQIQPEVPRSDNTETLPMSSYRMRTPPLESGHIRQRSNIFVSVWQPNPISISRHAPYRIHGRTACQTMRPHIVHKITAESSYLRACIDHVNAHTASRHGRFFLAVVPVDRTDLHQQPLLARKYFSCRWIDSE
ncbi:hypothetical protein DAEQUDRAFT_760141 [Daedalea quercina L-15889]|uniref:Uncharacterized protein n=1 Tax=Daedalea quercina L-15889 TaxID=1314783 RepID=A0A165L865_9APHY|nr:hypothetical protein DAEQUDRAFT_760141 [Daedalea quercina L-15889]